MPRVFVPQHRWTFNKFTGRTRKDGDMTPVMFFGHPIFMLAEGRIRDSQVSRIVRVFESFMFDYSPDDFIMATGDTVAQAIAINIALRHTGGRIKLVRWRPNSKIFREFSLNIEGATHGNASAADNA